MSNPLFAEAFAAERAALVRTVTPDATAPLGFGTDLSCVSDFAVDYSEVDPLSVRALIEALIRRLTTPRGTLIDDASYGYDTRALLNSGATPDTLRDESLAIAGECAKDDRVDRATVGELEYTEATKTLRIGIDIEPADVSVSAFSFTFIVTSADVVSAEINANA